MADVPRSRVSTSDRASHWTEDERRTTVVATAAHRAEALEAECAVFRMDTVVCLEPGVLLQNLTKANAREGQAAQVECDRGGLVPRDP